MNAIVESRRPWVLVVTVYFAILVSSKNTQYATANDLWGPTAGNFHCSPSPSSFLASHISIIRGGSMEEGSSKSPEEDGDDSSGASSVEIEVEGGVVDVEAVAEEDSESVFEEDVDSDKSSSSLTAIATELRLEGKKHHDQGDFVKAAEVFQRAADTLLSGDGDGVTKLRMSEDYATCRLHQALCNLKSENYELCIEACTDVLQDGSDDASSGSSHSPAINARAYHRRAKAKMALGDNAGALQDARTASFLGDGKAVNLYGKLMRETSSSDLSSLMNPFGPTGSSASSSLASPLSSPHSALLESLMKKSSGGSGSSPGGFPDFSPASLLMGNGGGSNLLGALGSGGSGMAKSVVKNLVKKLDDESTHETICNFLQKTNTAQLKSFASMAGIDSSALQDSQLDKVASFCHGITPKGIRRTVRGTKVIVYFAKVIRRALKVIQKYKSLIVAALILQWTKSAILRPLPIDTRAAKKAAKLAAKQALNDAMKASRAGFF